ncbi:MAG: folate-binding protein [Pseudomonadota bacterium]
MSDPFDSSRAILTLTGPDAAHLLQGILTQDITKLNDDKIQFAALLSPQGKILHDMFVITGDNQILLDTPAMYKDILLKRLAMYKLRAQVTIADASDHLHVHYGAADGLADPRHPDLPTRSYEPAAVTPLTPADYRARSLALGIPDSAHDFAPDEVVALDAGYDLLHAISFTKGCYVGQEVTARMHYKNIARRGFFILESDLLPPRLALLKFEDVEAKNGAVTVDNHPYHAHLPAWLKPKFDQFQSASKKQ